MAISVSVGSTGTVGTVDYNSTIYRALLQIKVNSISIVNNTSNITVNWIYQKRAADPYGAYNVNGSSGVSLNINGTAYTIGSADFDLRSAASGATQILATKTLNITHDDDGGKSITVGGSHTTGISWGTKSVRAQTVNLPPIPRASTISSVPASVAAGAAVTVAIGRKSTAFTHKVVFSLGGYSQSYTGVATSQAFTIPLSWCAAMPSSNSGSATVTVTTYNGSTKVGGATSKGFTVTVPSSVVPTISSFTATPVNNNVPAAWGIYVQNQSSVKLAASAAGAYGSTISSYVISGDGYSDTASTFTTGTINNSKAVSYKVTVKDSRGRSASKTLSIAVEAYEPPSLLDTTTCDRCTSTGTISDAGTYIKVLAKTAYSTCASKNTLSISCRYMSGGGSWESGPALSPDTAKVFGSGLISVDESYKVEITVKDSFVSRSTTFSVGTSSCVIDILKTGKGIAFGKASELSEVVDMGWTAYAGKGLAGCTVGTASYIPFPENNVFKDMAVEVKGCLKITLPQGWTSTMLKFTVDIYNFAVGSSCSYTISGYPHSTSKQWHNCTAAVTAGTNLKFARLPVRFGHDGTRCAVYIGWGDTVWSYPTVTIRDITASYSNYDTTKWIRGWDIGFVGSLGTISATIDNPFSVDAGIDSRIQSGSLVVPVPAANTNVHFAVKFPAAFRTAPVVTACSSSASPQALSGICTRDVTTSGFTVSFRRTDTASTGINWIAVE